MTAFLALAVALGTACSISSQANGLYPSLPFQPQVSYAMSGIIVANPESDPYENVAVRVFIGSSLYAASIGTIPPGGSRRVPWENLLNDRGESFRPGQPRTSELEVRAKFRGNDDHKDFSAPTSPDK